jgi:SAM-dependent methyltransferase
LVVVYIIEAFDQLGVNLHLLQEHDTVPEIPCMPNHIQLMSRLLTILAESGIIDRRGCLFSRSMKPVPTESSAVLLDQLLASYPQYSIDCKLVSVTGSHLAKCLGGEEDAVQLLFGNAASKDLLSNFYRDSPIFKTSTDLLLDLLDRVMPPVSSCQTPFRILEVGAGTGGTTARLCEFLQSQHRAVEYTFTDISSTMLNAARKKFLQQYPWMDFCILDLERDVPATLQGKYDIVIGTYVVHATSDVVNSCTRIKSLLRKDGFMVLLEITCIINWFDLVFGLLSGWWSAKDGRSYPLQPAEVWSRYLRDAGFSSYGCTTGSTKESTTQQLIVGSTRQAQTVTRYEVKCYEIETVPYKEVDDLRIQADIYYPTPQYQSSAPMPIGR